MKVDNNQNNQDIEFQTLERELLTLRDSVTPPQQVLTSILEVTKLAGPRYTGREQVVSSASFASLRFYFLPVAMVALFLTIGLWPKGDKILETSDGLAFESSQSELAIASDLDDVVASEDLEMTDLEIAMAEI